MDLERKPARIIKRLEQWKIPILLAAVGIGILLLPTGGRGASPPPAATEPAEDTTEARMEQILSAVEGAGTVRVMLTRMDSGQTEYQTDVQTIRNANGTEEKTATVIRGGSQGDGLVRRVLSPEYLGAAVVSQGADRPEVCLKLRRAVSALTGLPSNRITVLSMKKS